MRVDPKLWFLALALVAACTSPAAPGDAETTDASDDGSPRSHDAGRPPIIGVAEVDTRFVTRDHMIASFEMQQSGEPLAQALGRDLGGFDRNLIPPNLYTDPAGYPDGGAAAPIPDLVGFATAIELYEYSKQPMNALALESGAGIPLLYGPVVNPSGLRGTAALALLRPRIEDYALSSHLGVRGSTGMSTAYFVVPVPTADPTNVLGWRGLLPTFLPYASFDPTIHATVGLAGDCSITPGDGDDGRGGVPANPVGDYECDYNELNVPRAALDTTFGPGSAGWASWKYALWITNYLQIMHDTSGTSIGSVAPGDLAQVGSEANTIVGTQSELGGDPTMMGLPGTYLGSSDIEGFQASVMIDELDNAAEAWLTTLTTADGTTLSGFASVSDALAYDYVAPLRWIPAEIAVTETADASGFPRPSYALHSSESRLLDLLGLAGGYAQLYGVTDEHNADTGGAVPARVYFDGDPFEHDDQLADGEATLHDRSLALMKVLFVILDRVHRDPSSGLLVDTVTFSGATPTRGATLSTTSAAYTITALRTVRRSLSSHLTLYSNSTPDLATSATPLDGTSMAGAPDGSRLAMRLGALIHAHAELLYTQLTDDTGVARAGFDLTMSTPTDDASVLDAHAAAIDGLLEAFLATGDTRYRDRASAVFAHMESTLWDPAARVYHSAADAAAPIEYTPLRLALLTRALREMYKLVGQQPGNDELATRLEARIARLVKLVLDGWDDRNDDGTVDWPSECVRVIDGLPRGGLQMAERALTGEIGLAGGMPTRDRDHDCVPEIDDVELPAALASRIVLTIAP